MPIAPAQRPAAAGEHTVPVACFQRPARRCRNRPGGVAELVVQFAPAGDPADGAVAGITLHRLRRHRPAALELTRRRAPRPGQGVEAGPDDQLRPRPGAVAFGAVAFGAGTLPGELDHRIGTALAIAAGVILDRFHE